MVFFLGGGGGAVDREACIETAMGGGREAPHLAGFKPKKTEAQRTGVLCGQNPPV
jgi:hypothetical protein